MPHISFRCSGRYFQISGSNFPEYLSRDRIDGVNIRRTPGEIQGAVDRQWGCLERHFAGKIERPGQAQVIDGARIDPAEAAEIGLAETRRCGCLQFSRATPFNAASVSLHVPPAGQMAATRNAAGRKLRHHRRSPKTLRERTSAAASTKVLRRGDRLLTRHVLHSTVRGGHEAIGGYNGPGLT